MEACLETGNDPAGGGLNLTMVVQDLNKRFVYTDFTTLLGQGGGT
jgi:hypothetical protein